MCLQVSGAAASSLRWIIPRGNLECGGRGELALHRTEERGSGTGVRAGDTALGAAERRGDEQMRLILEVGVCDAFTRFPRRSPSYGGQAARSLHFVPHFIAHLNPHLLGYA